MVNHDSAGCGYAESKQDAEHPEYTHDDDDKVICGTAEENKVVQISNADGQLAAECPGIVKLQKVIGVVD